jgi:DNA-binding NarL/FixJ family response regulator
VTTPSRRCRNGARSWLRHLVDDLVYGQRGDPLAVVRQLVNQQVATATDVNETLPASLAVIIADTLRLDHVAYLVLLDLHLPDKSGLDVNRLLAATTPTSRSSCSPCQKTTTRQSQRYATVPAGTSSKGADPTHIEHVIDSVMAGGVVLDQGVAQAMAELAQLRAATVSSPFPQLSPREADILELIARGLDNQTIARQLVLTPKTVRNHVSNVLAKLNARRPIAGDRHRPPQRTRADGRARVAP